MEDIVAKVVLNYLNGTIFIGSVYLISIKAVYIRPGNILYNNVEYWPIKFHNFVSPDFTSSKILPNICHYP